MPQLRFPAICVCVLLGLASARAGSLAAPLRAATWEAWEPIGEQDPRAELVLILEEHVASQADHSVLSQALLGVRSEAAAALFEVLCSGVVPAAWREQTGKALVLGEPHLKTIELSIQGLPVEQLRTLFAKLNEVEKRSLFRIKAFQILGRSGSSRDLGLMLKLGTPWGSRSGVIALSARRKLEAVMLSLSERDPRVLQELGALFGSAHEALQPSIISILGQVGSEQALLVLGALLGVDGRLDPYVLNSIVRCANLVAHPVDSNLMTRVRGKLKASDLHTSLGAMAAAGALEDFESIPFLLDALVESNRQVSSQQVRSQAGRALKALTGIGYGLDETRWRRWYERELAWWRDEVPGLRRDLESGTQKEARLALGELSASKLDRHALTQLLLAGLERSEPEILVLTCRGLAFLHSKLAIEPLIELLNHREDLVVEASHRALMGITQMKIPADPSLWASQTQDF